MACVRVGEHTVCVGDIVYYRLGALLIPSEVLDVTDAAENTLTLRVGGSIRKGVGYNETRFGSWRVDRR